MSLFASFIEFGIQLIFIIIFIFYSIRGMIVRKNINIFLPFFLIGVLLCFELSFGVYEVFSNAVWMIKDFLIFVCLVLFFVSLRRYKK